MTQTLNEIKEEFERIANDIIKRVENNSNDVQLKIKELTRLNLEYAKELKESGK